MHTQCYFMWMCVSIFTTRRVTISAVCFRGRCLLSPCMHQPFVALKSLHSLYVSLRQRNDVDAFWLKPSILTLCCPINVLIADFRSHIIHMHSTQMIIERRLSNRYADQSPKQYEVKVREFKHVFSYIYSPKNIFANSSIKWSYVTSESSSVLL